MNIPPRLDNPTRLPKKGNRFIICGIAGFSRNRTTTSIPNGRRFAVALLKTIESRGKHATGVGWWDRNTDIPWYSKNPGPARHVAETLALPKTGITTLIGHTRYLTLGSAQDNDNNHPVVANHIVCTHNGRVENHNDLISLAGMKDERVGIVDSWALPALLSKQEELGASHPTELLELVEGVASLAWLDSSEPDVLHLARCSTRPLTIGWTRKGDLVYSSTKTTLANAAKLAHIRVEDVMDVPEGVYVRVVNGEFEEWTEFKVNHPTVTEDLDMPGARRETVHLPMSGVTSYDPDEYDVMGYDEWVARNDERIALADNLGLDRLEDFDSWEEQMSNRLDGIDWDQIIPRRGHKGFTK